MGRGRGSIWEFTVMYSTCGVLSISDPPSEFQANNHQFCEFRVFIGGFGKIARPSAHTLTFPHTESQR